jgi:dimethylhistidine N-methyltransferase
MSQSAYWVLPTGGLAEGTSQQAFADDVLIGLSEHPKRIASMWFYDDIGSRLFRRITEQEEYYLTAAERQILQAYGRHMLAPLGHGPLDIIDLGAGDGHKTALLLEPLATAGADVRYVPVDISAAAMSQLLDRVQQRYEHLPVKGLVGEYFDSIRWLGKQGGRRKLVLFLGSNIGNFTRPRAHAFLRRLRNALAPGDGLLLGFDLKKDIDVLSRAYNDSAGITAQFNLNLLERVNRELGGHFDPRRFRHFSTYDVVTGAMHSYLVSLKDQTVAIDLLREEFSFEAWEALHTEYSYKYHEQDIDQLCRQSGFREEVRCRDERHWFCDVLWRVPQ